MGWGSEMGQANLFVWHSKGCVSTHSFIDDGKGRWKGSGDKASEFARFRFRMYGFILVKNSVNAIRERFRVMLIVANYIPSLTNLAAQTLYGNY